MSRDFMVKPNDVMKSVEVIAAKMQEFGVLKKKLYDEAESLATQWKGSTSEAFMSDLSTYEEIIVKLQNALADYCNGVSTAMNTYVDVDKKLADEVKTSLGSAKKV